MSLDELIYVADLKRQLADARAEVERLRGAWEAEKGVTLELINQAAIREKRIAATEAEVERLRAIVDKLPKTADRVPVYPGMHLWGISGGGCVHGMKTIRYIMATCGGLYDDRECTKCYSTREAADAAKEKKP